MQAGGYVADPEPDKVKPDRGPFMLACVHGNATAIEALTEPCCRLQALKVAPSCWTCLQWALQPMFAFIMS